MIQSLGQVMLYVDDFKQSIHFWTDIMGFKVKAQEKLPEGYEWIEVAPDETSETTIVIFDKAFIKKYSPDVNLGTPSLMFKTEDIEGLYTDFKEKGVQVGEMVEQPSGSVFNFSDDEGNYFAVSENG